MTVLSLNLIGQSIFELESGNGNVDGQTNGKKRTNRRNYTNFEQNLAMIVIYLPVKFEFNWTKRFQVRVRKQKCSRMDVGHINLIGGLVTCNPPKNYDAVKFINCRIDVNRK